MGIVKRRLADQSHISMPQFSHHHVGLSQERVKTIPNGLIIIQKINLWAIIPFICKRLVRTVLIFTESSDQLSRAT
ncbi:hypothetical protein, partial [Salmonella enterica]|uniref:hypothetical protein n=1 Tax=Salmonella enterica TaxID=28901 RepID=UPI001E39E7ED